MKNIKLFMTLLAGAFIVVACDPIEDDGLRDKNYNNPGQPISKADLTAAISVTQPISNSDNAIEGDQYVVIDNKRPDLAGVWHVEFGATNLVTTSNHDTLIYQANGDYKIYYTAFSANQVVETDPISITVTNVFDDWDNYFTGATDKADKTATKTWKFRETTWGSICNMGAHGGWKYTSAGYTPESNFAWWGSMSAASAGEQKMVLDFAGHKLTTYNADGSIRDSGTFGYTHENPEDLVVGEFISSVPVLGGQYDECGENKTSNKFWILTLTDEYITLYHPDKYSGAGDWDDYGWYVYYKKE